MRFEIQQSPSTHLTSVLRGGGEWRWQLLDEHGTVVAASIGYDHRMGCAAAVQTLQAEAAAAPLAYRIHGEAAQ